MIRTHYAKELTGGLDGKRVTVAGWVHEVRETAKVTFLILRDMTGTVQVIGKKDVTSDSIMKAMLLPKESVVKVTGIVKASSEAKAGFEILPEEVVDLNPLSIKIPFEVTGKVPVDLDVRLNYRYIDLRRAEPTAIFKIESTILNSFSRIMSGMGFEEIRTPSMISESSEGGSELFPIAYFEKAAYLAQSPQLYKQLAIVGGMDKVFMVMPVFRAEKSNTIYHLTEITQMDIEMGFADAEDVIKILSETVISIIRDVKEKNKAELDTLKVDLRVPEVKVVTYSEAIEKLKAKGHKIEFGYDISREHESALQKAYGDAVVVKDFPASLRAFYSMPKADDPELTNSFDFIYKGLEISSGAQRIHLPELLIKSLEKKGLNPKHFESFYINAFRCGAPPHAGWSIGLERFAIGITGAGNIRECSLFPRDRKRLTP